MKTHTVSHSALTDALQSFAPSDDLDATDAALQSIADETGTTLDRDDSQNRWRFHIDGDPVASVHANVQTDTYRIEHHQRPIPDREVRATSDPNPAGRQVCDYSGVSTADLLVLWRAVNAVPASQLDGFATSAVSLRLNTELARRPRAEVNAAVEALAL